MRGGTRDKEETIVGESDEVEESRVGVGQGSAPRAIRPDGGERSKEEDKPAVAGTATGGTQPRIAGGSPNGVEEAVVVEVPSTSMSSEPIQA